MELSRTYYECCHAAVERFHRLHGSLAMARAHDAACCLPERGGEILLTLARKHGDNPSFKQLCKNIKNR